MPHHPLSRIIEQTASIVVMTDVHGVVEYVNPAFEKVTGYTSDEVLGKNPDFFSSDRQSEEFYAHMWSTLLAGKVYSNNLIHKRKDGSLFHTEITITPLIDDNTDITHFMVIARDISEHIRDKTHPIQHDSLTDLPNRNLFMDRLQQAISKAQHHHRLVAVLFLDLDRFRNINDSLGHTAGDQLLRQLGERFRKTIREGDTIARFGGDEFAILLDDFDSDNSLSLIAQKILNSLAMAFEINSHEIFITASIGISISPHDGDDPDTLLRNADIAMCRARELGKNNFQYYSEAMTAHVFEHLSLENSLRHALERNEFILHYQPQVDTRSGKIFGVEALLRWQHPELGLVMPNHFISLLEETGLIEPVGIWVLETACKQSRQWHQSGIGFVHMSVNLSSRQFNNRHFIASLQNIIKETQVNPQYLELELTESMLMRNTSSIITALKNLNALGVRFAIDDFGTGYSSLNYLRRFPIDTIKIDRAFIRDITHDTDDRAICSAIIGMTQSLSLKVIAEGVETHAQLDILKTKECHYIQGNVFSPAVPAAKITQMLADQLLI
ncbi:MAG TPA: EAL domain-containing protein [Gammaproteobacteria bacterium]|nr:EAL domain-containing protein [Gammaproteobacteria bacterium]